MSLFVLVRPGTVPERLFLARAYLWARRPQLAVLAAVASAVTCGIVYLLGKRVDLWLIPVGPVATAIGIVAGLAVAVLWTPKSRRIVFEPNELRDEIVGGRSLGRTWAWVRGVREEPTALEVTFTLPRPFIMRIPRAHMPEGQYEQFKRLFLAKGKLKPPHAADLRTFL